MFWLLQLFTRIHAVPLSSPSHLIFDPSSLSVWLSCLPCFDSPLQDIASSIFLPLPASHCNAMQNCLSLLPKRRPHFSPSGFLPARFFYLQCPFQTPYPSEPPPVSISVLSFPNPSLAPRSLPRKVFSSPERCRLLTAGGRTPGFVRSLWTAAALCRGAGAACLQLLAERLHGEDVFLYHLHAHCMLSHPSFQCASRLSSLDLTPSRRLFSHTFLVPLAVEPHHGNVPWSRRATHCGAVLSVPQCIFGRRCGIYHTSTTCSIYWKDCVMHKYWKASMVTFDYSPVFMSL